MSPVHVDIWDGAAWRPYAGAPVVDPVGPFFIHGVTMPVPVGAWGDRNVAPRFDYDPTNPAVLPSDGVAWTVIDGDYTIATAGEYHHLWVKGQINITAKNVYLHDSVERGRPGITSAKYGIFLQGAATALDANVRIEFCDIGVDPANYTYNHATGIRPSGATVLRCYVWGYVDAIMPYGATLTVRDSYLVAGDHLSYDGGFHPDGTHDDAVQTEAGGIRLEVSGCVVVGGWTSAFIFTNNVAGGYVSVLIVDNWVFGRGGSKFNISASNITGLQIKRNKLEKYLKNYDILITVTNRVAANFGMTGTTGDVSDWVAGPDANVYIDDGLPCRVHNG